MTTPSTPPIIVEKAPFSAEQTERHKKLRRFNWFAVYLPALLATAGAVAALIYLTTLTFAPEPAQSRMLASGLADFWLIVTVLCPASLVCGLFPALGVFALVKRAQSGSIVRVRVQRLSARAENALVTAQQKTAEAQPKVANPIIRARGGLAFIKRLLQKLYQIITRSST
jgi:hypothetical protein